MPSFFKKSGKIPSPNIKPPLPPNSQQEREPVGDSSPSRTSRAIVMSSKSSSAIVNRQSKYYQGDDDGADFSSSSDMCTPAKQRRLNNDYIDDGSDEEESPFNDALQSSELFDAEHELDCRLGQQKRNPSHPSPFLRSTTSARFAEGQSIEVGRTASEKIKVSPSSSMQLSAWPESGEKDHKPVFPEDLESMNPSLPSQQTSIPKSESRTGLLELNRSPITPTTPTTPSTTGASPGDQLEKENGKSPLQWKSKRYRWILLLIVVLAVAAVTVGVVVGTSGGSDDEGRPLEAGLTPAPSAAATEPGTPATSVPTLQSQLLPSQEPSEIPTDSPTIPPLNDACYFARGPLTIGGIPYDGVLNDASAILNTITDLPSTCLEDSTGDSDSVGGSQTGLWYTVTGGDEVLRVSTCASDTDEDTRISVYRGSCPRNRAFASHSGLECVSANDDFCGQHASVSWYAEKGVNYFILVHTPETNTAVPFKLRVTYEDNGSCDTAIGPIDGSVTIGSMRGAGMEALFTCSFNFATLGQVWYKVKGTGTWMVASTCDPITNFEARIDVITGSCAASKCPAIRDSDCGNGYQIVWKSEADVYYWLLIFKNINLPGSLFGVTIDTFDPVANDECVDSVSVELGSTIIQGSTIRATHEELDQELGNQQNCNFDDDSQPGVWYSVVGTGETLLASTCNSETTFASKITILTGSCSSKVCVVSNEQFCGEKASVYWESQAGVTYFIFVHGAGYGVSANVGDFGLVVDSFVTAENDECENAQVVSNETMFGSTFAATVETVESCDSLDGEAPGIWYTVLGTGAVMRAATCDPATTFDTKISVYQGSCGDLNCVIADDNSCGIQSSVRWTARVGVTYYILVHGRRSSFVGDFGLIVEEYTPTVANDFCDGAFTISTDGGFSTGSTATAYFDNAGECGVRNSAAGVWYQLEGTGTRLQASLCNDETDYDTALSVYTGECESLECVAGDDNSGGTCGWKSAVSWVTQPDTTYFLLVHGYDVRVGNFGLSVEEPLTAVLNDYCVRATLLNIGAEVIKGTTVGAFDDETPSCVDVDQTGAGVWYSVVGNGGFLEASTCNNDVDRGTNFNTKLSVFSGSCGSLECARADDNACGFQSRVVWKTESGTTYYILVHGHSEGNFGLTVNRFVSGQKNDFCENAGDPLLPTDEVIYGSTVGASFDDMDTCGATNTGPGVWYIIFGTGERLKADTCNPYTNFDTKLSVYTGLDCTKLTCMDGNDDGCGLQSSITFDTEIGELYYVLVHGWGTNKEGKFGLTVSGSDIF